jgi:hypothetical protein
MSRGPEFITLDREEQTLALPDFYAADAALPRQVERRQHALMHGWGGPPQVISCYIDDAGAGRTQYMLLRVPPYCQWMRWGVLGYDGWLCLLQTAVDTNGVTMGGNYRSLETAQWVWGSNETPAGSPPAADDTGRAVKVSSSLSATWQDVEVTVTVTGPGVGKGIRALAFYPVLSTT